MNETPKKKILFLCTGNSCRSQMAEAWTKNLKGNAFEAYSAGIAPKTVDPLAIEAMSEVGIDISSNLSKDISEIGESDFDYVVTVCDNANENCPFYPAKTKRIHKSFEDPPKSAESLRTKEEKMGIYRRVRDEIRDFIEGFPESLDKS
jgi:arsenate reductase